MSNHLAISLLDFIVTERHLHQINLHGPWTLEKVNSGKEYSQRSKYPVSIDSNLYAAKHEDVAHPERQFKVSRNFNKPTGIEDSQSIYLEFKLNVSLQRCVVNGREMEIGTSDAVQIDLKNELIAFNKVELYVELPETIREDSQVFESSKLVIV